MRRLVRVRHVPVVAALAVLTCSGPRGIAHTEDGLVVLESAVAGASVNRESAALYVHLRNLGEEDDVLAEITVEGVGWTEVHETVAESGRLRMRPLARPLLPAGGALRMATGGVHVMLRNLSMPPAAGDTLVGSIRLESGRTLPLTAPVVRLSELENR